ncbi:BrnA antitoxin family protein [Methylocapsa palsarum]|uniref:Uncharacterized conserved protein, DUF4415 family n=1 Tax=Methylocapsa palsarum TaxID=1612308 RepID=A0A1I4CSG8_9HYPH|nr:BrnA antitoxin family protein [Methylocapsa palsarum]SFK83229.1 Uncharacterized conserved protein, DUF4415 family [Methylocapsa palsarum]
MTASKQNTKIDDSKIGSDMAKVDAHVITPEEYEELPEITDEFFETGKYSSGGQPVSKEEGLAALAATLRPGRPRAQNPKQVVNIRLSPDVLDAFRATGRGWQTRVNEALREWLKEHP